MWDNIVTLSEDKLQVVARLPSGFVVDASFDNKTLPPALEALNASNYFLFEEEVLRFVTPVSYTHLTLPTRLMV